MHKPEKVISRSPRPEDIAGFELEKDLQDEQEEVDEDEESSESEADSDEELKPDFENVDIENIPVTTPSEYGADEPLDKLRYILCFHAFLSTKNIFFPIY